MQRILITPDQLRSLSAQLQQTAGELQSVEGRVSSALGDLAWEARQKAGVDGQANRARSQARALAAQAEEMGRYLQRKAQAFEEADGQGVSGVGQVFGAFTEWVQSAPSWWGFPSQQVNAWWNLGSVLGEPSPIELLSLPVAGGAAVVGLASLTPLSQAFSKVEDFGERIWNWLRRKGWKTDDELAASQRHRSRFGALLGQEDEAEGSSEPQPESKPKTAPTAPHAPSAQPAKGEWWHNVPVQSQQGLKYKGQKTAYGCTPTATSMILDYWHAQNPANKTMSAQKLLDINAGQGVFHSKGMSASNILDEVKGLGYGVTDVHANSNLDTLKKAVSEGPVLAIVKLGMKATGTNHAVVVIGISDDGQVRINDPWTGKAHTYSWNEFSKSWGANFGKDVPKNSFVAIRPS